ncbi:hypothetical protein CQW23_33647 [Capsicum baccatum]|uniref:Uncharacterized protein n=1 Tax=Capsicum baccatum TaxID=33114 RepID=A0A2G2V1A5_CAPBA|nr:hypothetical protein CQW23_33647 [Capsicum baccatum]
MDTLHTLPLFSFPESNAIPKTESRRHLYTTLSVSTLRIRLMGSPGPIVIVVLATRDKEDPQLQALRLSDADRYAFKSRLASPGDGGTYYHLLIAIDRSGFEPECPSSYVSKWIEKPPPKGAHRAGPRLPKIDWKKARMLFTFKSNPRLVRNEETGGERALVMLDCVGEVGQKSSQSNRRELIPSLEPLDRRCRGSKHRNWCLFLSCSSSKERITSARERTSPVWIERVSRSRSPDGLSPSLAAKPTETSSQESEVEASSSLDRRARHSVANGARQEGGFTSLVTKEGQLTKGGKKSQHLRRLLRSQSGIYLSQRKYVLDLQHETGMLGSKPVDTPMDQHTKLIADQDELLPDPGRYRRPQIVCLLETRMKASGMERISWRLRYEKALVIEPIGLSGGMSSEAMEKIKVLLTQNYECYLKGEKSRAELRAESIDTRNSLERAARDHYIYLLNSAPIHILPVGTTIEDSPRELNLAIVELIPPILFLGPTEDLQVPIDSTPILVFGYSSSYPGGSRG